MIGTQWPFDRHKKPAALFIGLRRFLEIGGDGEIEPTSRPHAYAAGVLYLDDRYVFSLQAFLALRYAELYFLAFIQWLVAAGVLDLLKMYENIGAWFLLNKAEAFIRIKPFNGASSDCRHDESYKN